MNFSNVSPSHRLQFFTNYPSMGPFHGVQSFRNRLLQRGSPMGSQALPANLLQHGLFSPQVHGTCQEPAPAWAPHRLTASFGHIHLLWREVLHRLRVEICSTVDPHGLQGTACLTMVFITGCRGLCSGVSHASSPLLLHGPWCLQDCFTLSHSSLSTAASPQSFFFLS